MPRSTTRSGASGHQPGELAVELLWQLKAVSPSAAATAEAEYRFHDIRRWRFDLAFPSNRVAVEIDGGAYVGGRHVSGPGFEADCEKHSEAAALGWRVLRVTPRHVRDGRALGWLERALSRGEK